MKNPFNGNEMIPVNERRTWSFRGETFFYNYSGWKDEKTGDLFTSDDNDDASFLQVTNQYRERYGVPYMDQIVALRKMYGLSASKMSLVLGFGANQYRKYEMGEVPNISNGRMILSAFDPKVMLGYVASARHELSEDEYKKITDKITSMLEDAEAQRIDDYETHRIFSYDRGAVNGYAQQSLTRLKNAMLFVLEKISDVWVTKMNKVLFYIDFLSYKKYGSAITGLAYRAISYGPVPERWEKVYCQFDEISQEPKQIGKYGGNMLQSSTKPDLSYFTEKELLILNTVCKALKNLNASQISDLSHKEKLWLDYKDKRAIIPFKDAYLLAGIDVPV